MALAVSSSSWSQRSSNTIPILRDPLEPLVESIKNFEAGLTLQQRTRLRELKSVPDADAVISFTAELDAVGRSKRRHSVAVKLHAFLQSAGDFSKVIDTLASSKPEIVALVWGSVRFILLVCAM